MAAKGTDVGIAFDDAMSGALDGMADRVLAAAKMIASTEAVQLKSYMQRKRPWTDRTGAAKARLDATVSSPNSHTVRITLSHGVNYGVFLELAHGAKYAIIKPTIKRRGPEVYEAFNKFIEKLG